MVKIKPACPTQFPACLSCNHLVGFVSTACLYVFLACPAEMLLGLGDFQVGYVYDRPVCFQVWSVCGVLIHNQDRVASFSRQDGNSIGQDGKCNRQAVEIQNRMISNVGKKHSLDTESWRVSEISNIFDILTDQPRQARKLQPILTESKHCS